MLAAVGLARSDAEASAFAGCPAFNMFENINLDAQRVSGLDHGAVFECFDLAQHVPVVLRVLFCQERASGLDHSFEHHDAGEDRERGEVIAQIFLCGGDLLERDDAVIAAEEYLR